MNFVVRSRVTSGDWLKYKDIISLRYFETYDIAYYSSAEEQKTNAGFDDVYDNIGMEMDLYMKNIKLSLFVLHFE